MTATASDRDDQDTHALTRPWDDAAALGGMSEVPARRRSGDSLFQSLMRLWPRDEVRPEASARTMAALRAVFRGSLADVLQAALAKGDEAAERRLKALLRQIVQARHPQDLWHLRASVFTEVARAHDQAEAQRRLHRLSESLADGKRLLRRLLD